MRNPIEWFLTVFGATTQPSVLTLFTPVLRRPRGRVLQLAVGGGTIAAIGVAGMIGMAAFGLLMAAMAVIYFLSTQVLGLELKLDPRAFYEQAQRAAQAGYGPN